MTAVLRASANGAANPEYLNPIQLLDYTRWVAADVVRFCYESSGSEGLRNPSALGRCMRDMYAATQHIFVDGNAMVDVVVPILQHWKMAGAELAAAR